VSSWIGGARDATDAHASGGRPGRRRRAWWRTTARSDPGTGTPRSSHRPPCRSDSRWTMPAVTATTGPSRWSLPNSRRKKQITRKLHRR